MTAKELMTKLQRDKGFLERKKNKDAKLGELRKIYNEDQRELLFELSQLGFELKSVWDFVNMKNNYLDAVPVLIDHLKKEHHPKILAGIARSLAIPALSHNDDLWDLLVKLYETTPKNSDICVPQERGAQEGVAVALRALATPARAQALKYLISTYPDGDGASHLQVKLDEFDG